MWLVGSKNQPVHGRVESLGWGVRPMDAGDPGLVNVGRTLEWVIVAQRFPVRVRLDDLPGGVARLGATANILVTHGDNRCSGRSSRRGRAASQRPLERHSVALWSSPS